jgi:hypothetical protein
MELIRIFFDRGRGSLSADHQVVGLAAAVLILADTFFLDFPAAGLVAAVDVCSGLLGLADFLMVTLGCLGASVTG